MRPVALSIAAVAAAAALAGCGKSPSNNQGDAAQAGSSAQSTTSGSTTAAEPSDAQKKAAVATLPAPYNGADLENGENKFQVCKSCHTLGAGGPDMTGPNLWAIFGQKVGAKPGFKFSDAMKAQSFTWDAAELDKWLTDPKAMIPGTKMTFPGFKDPKDRIDVIGYLKAETTPAS